ncbi:uncharacterized protein LAESUDRAFT_728044 [Laetiporus sulphureus 93-53]|uniref:HMG box domain-containing protein n=1 Tax=Laetiporus sulphureus 93-53 TaxID=1314785 RepID=A0A165DCB2_9APHY|nr:uncharacterized protein LAESUDRAFT_728044 [Laetiporus sulphureus 93-53]KZT04548.1 hypothetical protein LAESUDRAFT_728044 [Laetiporus sulphureus 93-53]
MPAERTRASKRKVIEDASLTWTPPLDTSTPQSIAFAPNITPGTFNDPPSPVESIAESILFPSTADTPAPSKRTTHSRKKPENHIPRPPNAFILFRSSFIKNQHVSSEVETNHSTLSKIIGLTWQSLPHEERQIWHAKAKAALEEHKRKWPEYAFRPLHTKGKGGTEKRKVREVGPKDMKRCAKIAELLVEGKKGAELDVAIQEFDRHHVPEIVTRFETPITARTFRRSSSAPVPDTEHTKPMFFASSPAPSSLKSKVRASTSQPRTPSPAPSEAYGSSLCESDAESKCSSPASPLSAVSQVETYSLPDSTINFDTFSFNTCSPAAVDTCDPFVSYQTSLHVFSPAPHLAYAPQDDAFDPTCLSINTTLLDTWASSPSPVSSIPSTPQSFPTAPSVCESPFAMLTGDMPSMLDQFSSQSYDFYTHDVNIANGCHPGYAQISGIDMQFSATSIGASKEGMSALYDRSALSPVDGEFSPSFLPPMPSFVM